MKVAYQKTNYFYHQCSEQEWFDDVSSYWNLDYSNKKGGEKYLNVVSSYSKPSSATTPKAPRLLFHSMI
jgi:hypothetical protein